MSTKLTENFTLEEMQQSNTATRLGLPNVIPAELIPNALLCAERLELVRAHFGRKVRVLSCYRSPAVNHAVGGSATSAHPKAMAVDFRVDDTPVAEVSKWCAENIPDYDQVIHEFDQWTHMGFSKTSPRRQVLTAKKTEGKTVYHHGLEV